MAYPARTRVHRSLAATLLGIALLALLSACGMNAQTTQPYTPAEGVNVNVGPTGQWVMVRNLMILSHADGSGFVSAGIDSVNRDALIAVSGHPFKPDGSAGAEFTTTMSAPIALPPGALVQLTDRGLVEVKSPDLIVGGDAELTLSFRVAGDETLKVPVVDANQPPYVTISPSATPSRRP